MAMAPPHQLKFEPGAIEFVRQHGAEAHLASACDLVRECFPELREISVRLQEDPDEDNHTWVVMQVEMPAGHPQHLLSEEQKRYHEEFVRRPSLPYHPLSFALDVAVSQE